MIGANQCEHGQLARVCLTCEQAAEIAALRAEIAALQEDAKRWRALDAMLRHPGNPMTPTYRLVRTCSTFGDDRNVQDWRKEVDAARKGEA